MSTEKNVEIVQDFFAAVGRGDTERSLALVAEDIEWVIPGKDWPLAGTHHGHDGVAVAFQKAADEMPFSYPAPPEYLAQGDRVLVIGFAPANTSTRRHWRGLRRWTRQGQPSVGRMRRSDRGGRCISHRSPPPRTH
jgi:ketosteroid isomerase-like protein